MGGTPLRAFFICTYMRLWSAPVKIKRVGVIRPEYAVYCLFNSRMGRIIQEQGRGQLQQFKPDGNWGSTGAPNCEGFRPEEFQMLDFSARR
ncbi:MAG: conjugal transfer protein TraN [Pseudomonadota bacterium]